jgi:hypothetical protein
MIATQGLKTKYLLNFIKMEEKVEAIEETDQRRKLSMKNRDRN